MKRKSLTLALVVLMSATVMFSSCIGSFRLTQSVHGWNQTVGDKFVNELVFLVFCIVPVYEVSLFIDYVILNSIEFWSGENPMSAGEPRVIDTENGRYLVTQTPDGYELTNEQEGVTTALRFDEASQTWSVETADGELIPLMSFIEGGKVRMHLGNGTTTDVERSEAGVTAFRQTVEAHSPMYAVR